MNGSGSPLPGRQGGAWRGRWLPAALLGATLLLVPDLASADASERFKTSAEACDYIATQARGKPFLCPTSLPDRVVSERSRFVVDEADARTYLVGWKPEKGRSRLAVLRMPKRFLKLLRRFVAQEGRVRLIEVRDGRRAIRFCIESFCGVGWRERRSTYLIGARRDGSRQRFRRDLHAVTRGLEVIQPNPGPPVPPPEPDVGVWNFRTAAAACAFIAAKANNPPIMCPMALRDRLLPRRRGFELFGDFEGAQWWFLTWTPKKAGGLAELVREPKRSLRRDRSYLGGRGARETTVRGHRAIRSCHRAQRKRIHCRLTWRERGSTYTILRLSPSRSRERTRRDLRAIVRSLEPVSPEAGGP